MTDQPAHLPHVLIVEDDPLAADALKILFDNTGHRATTAHSVRDAVEQLEHDVPDAMLLDLTLGDGSGLDVLTRARARPAIVVALTGHDDQRTRTRCLEAGCRDVLVKPVSIRDLLAQMRGWLAERDATS